MPNPNFTPGPLTVIKTCVNYRVDTSGGSPVASIYGNFHDGALADARLIAAAPDLYAALENLSALIYRWRETGVTPNFSALAETSDDARAALAKARGE